jgi:hypothetical protein
LNRFVLNRLDEALAAVDDLLRKHRILKDEKQTE